ncbi:MAG: flagellar biosynthesis protein FlhF [Desulfobacteraceae bacterium]|nr:flagellar biosynthesis protein FlhF [Desulfobacteraceae bacterium]
MKIKRFEAENMAEALRLIKKEFGEEAVILSAKTMKKTGRLLGLGAGSQVVVTAAVDESAGQHAKADNGSVGATPRFELDEAANQTSNRQGSGIGRILQHFNPITLTGLKKLQPKIVQMMNESQVDQGRLPSSSPRRSFLDELMRQGLERAVAMELADQMTDLTPDHAKADDETVAVLSQIIDAKGWVAPRTKPGEAPGIIVLVGPSGAGKTTMVAKMAAQARMQARLSVGIISLDDQRIAGTVELQKYAGIMEIPFESAANEMALEQALQRLDTMELILVDTPGLGPQDRVGRDALKPLLQQLNATEIHLLLPAGARASVMTRAIDFFAPLGVNRLLPTHLDWSPQLGPLVNMVEFNRLPMGYLSTAPHVPEGMQLLTARYLAATLLSHDGARADQGMDEPVTIVQSRQSEVNRGIYVANRNSDIFHHHQCKAVQRISNEHIVNFKDSRQAMDQGFKPCRMCCMALFAPKPIDRPARHRVAGLRN